jgi:DNA-3-methyladenine glycosylase II
MPPTRTAIVDQQRHKGQDSGGLGVGRAPVADSRARESLRKADPVLARLIDARPGFRPRAWMDDLPPLDAFGTLIFQVAGQQLSVASTRRILERLWALFDGRNPTPAELLAVDPAALRATGFSGRKVETLRSVAQAFTDGTIDPGALASMSDDEILAALTAIKGIGPWTVQGMLIVALDRPDVVLPGDLALRKAIQRVYGLDELPTPAEVLERAEAWRPYRSLATAYLFGAGRKADATTAAVGVEAEQSRAVIKGGSGQADQVELARRCVGGDHGG